MDSYGSVHQELLDLVMNGDPRSPEVIRLGDILYDYLENDRIHNTALVSPKFFRALADVLRRMPEDDFYEIPDNLTFIVETEHITAQNVRLLASVSGKGHAVPITIDIIVIYHTALEYSHNALMGLLAHEIAHSFHEGKDYMKDEEMTDNLACKWGFENELQALEEEKKKHRSNIE